MEAAPRVSTNLTQLFARLIVCAMFLPTGARHLFQTERFTPEEAARIERMGSAASDAIKAVEKKVKPASLTLKDDAAAQPDEDGHRFRALNRLALRLDDAHVPQPVLVAWLVAVAELAGALSVLAGFLCRLTCPALTLVGAFTLWRVVWPALDGAMPWTWSVAQSQMAASWLAATLLPVSIFLLGPGQPSIEAALKKSGKGGKGGAKKPAEAE